MCKDIYSYNLVYNVFIQLLCFCDALFERILAWECGISKGSTQNEIVPVLVIFHLPYGKQRGVKICFYWFRYQNQNCFTHVALVSLVSHQCCSSSTRVALVLHSCRAFLTCVALVSLVLHSCRSRVARVALVSLLSCTRVLNQTRSILSFTVLKF